MSGNFAEMTIYTPFRDLLHAVKLRHGTDDDFFRPKNPTASAGCEPANLGTKGQHTTSRPPKPLSKMCTIFASSYDLLVQSVTLFFGLPRGMKPLTLL
jgi:hypothetical protein